MSRRDRHNQPAADRDANPATADRSVQASTAPVVEALSLMPAPGGWVFIRYKIQGDQVVDVQTTEPDTRTIARGHFTVACAELQLKERGGL